MRELYGTSDDANKKVEVDDGAAKRSNHHGDPTHQSSQDNYWPASEAIDQHTAHGSYKEKTKADQFKTNTIQVLIEAVTGIHLPRTSKGLNQGQKDSTAGDGTPSHFSIHCKATWPIILSPDNVKY